jgi:O-antigen ligase
LIGFYGLGLSNAVHSIEGRVNFPFLEGFYSGACLLAILNLMLIYYMSKCLDDPVRFSYLLAYFMFNLVLLFLINSRINILIFLFAAFLLSFKLIDKTRGLFVGSLFTVPVLLNSGLILYEILSLPFFVSILKRVDIEDVTTFNGRAFIWRNAMNWLTDDQRGILLGNGYKGHYFLDLISDVAKLWNSDVRDYHHMHLHSTSFEILVSQGVVGFVLFMILFYQLFAYYKKKYKHGEEQGIFFAVVVFLLFILQVDTFVYLESLGGVIFSLLLANVLITHPPKEMDYKDETQAAVIHPTSGQLRKNHGGLNNANGKNK